MNARDAIPSRTRAARPAGVPRRADADPCRAIVEALDTPAVLIEADGWVRAHSGAAAWLIGPGRPLGMTGGRIEPACESARGAWRGLLADATERGRADGELAFGGTRIGVRVLQVESRRFVAILRPMPDADAGACADAMLDRTVPGAGLTPSERAVLRGVLAGRRAREIAAERSTSEATVRTQIRSLLVKTGTSSIRELLLALLASHPPDPRRAA